MLLENGNVELLSEVYSITLLLIPFFLVRNESIYEREVELE